ncbi:MAG: stress response translation initiation inhibitor YciH [Rhizobacter sp.]|nr:stress response translation initiation inhibitor YciH [Rhizobacter sp.]
MQRPRTGGLVYSTEGGRTCPSCRRPIAACSCRATAAALPVRHRAVRVGRETRGRNGKTVTVVRDLGLGASELAALGKRLRSACGAGGTARDDGALEIQGDHVDRVLSLLGHEGIAAKRAGG